jgi:hypothetical protein
MSLISKSNFNLAYKEFKDEIVIYGVPAQEIITGTRIPLVEPTKYLYDAAGEVTGSKYDVDVNNKLTAEGVADFNYERSEHGRQLAIRESDTNGLLARFLLKLSPQAKVSLETKGGPTGYIAAKNARDTFRLHELTVETLQQGSGRSKNIHMTQLIGARQTGTFEEFLSFISELSALVLAAFGSTVYPGHIKFDDLVKSAFLNGVDQVFFAAQIDKALEDLSASTSSQLMERFQAFNLERGVAYTAGPTSHTSKALVAADEGVFIAPAVSVKAGDTLCEHCKRNGYKNAHNINDCGHYQRWVKAQEQLQIRLRAASASSGVVVPAKVASARALVAEYERSLLLLCVIDFERYAFLADFVQWFWDNAASMSIVNDLSCLVEVVALAVPFAIGGVNSGVMVTHRGLLPFLPRAIGVAYFAADARVNLLSLGFVQSQGGAYSSVGVDKLSVKSPDGTVIDVASILPGTLLPQVSANVFASGRYASIPASVGAVAVDSVVTSVVSVKRLGSARRRAKRIAFAASATNPGAFVLSADSVSVVLPVASSVSAKRHALVTSCVFPTASISPGIPVVSVVGPVAVASTSESVSMASVLPLALVSYPDANVPPGVALLFNGKKLCCVVSTDKRISRAAVFSGLVFDSSSSSESRACAAILPHLNAELRERCERVENLHQGPAAHCSDAVLKEALQNGLFAWSNLTPADVDLNRKYRGACPDCAAGKMRKKAMPPSQSFPATRVGQCVWGDLSVLSAKSAGGNLVAIRFTCDFSGDHHSVTAKSKSALDIYLAIMKYVHTRFNAYGFRVENLVMDAEPAFDPVIAMLGDCGIVLTLVDPGQHAQRIENIIGSQDRRKRAVLSFLPFRIPVKYDIYATRWADDCQNGLSNSRSRPSTADQLRTGKKRVPHYKYPHLGFGTVAMVPQFDNKQAAVAREFQVAMKSVEDAELGVCLGYSDEVPGDFLFLLANEQIVSRRVLQVVQVHPFGWPRKSVLRAELALPSTDPPFQGIQDIQSSVQVMSDARLPIVPVLSVIKSVAAAPVVVPTMVAQSIVIPPIIASTSVAPFLAPQTLEESDTSTVVSAVSALKENSVSFVPIVEQVVESVGVSAEASGLVQSEAVSTRRTGGRKPPGFWAGAGAHVASSVVTSASNEAWTLVTRSKSNRQSVVKAPVYSSVVPKIPTAVAQLKSVVVPTLVVRRSRNRNFYSRASKPVVSVPTALVADRLSSAELTLIESLIVANCKDALAVELKSFDTQRSDEFDLGGAVAYFAAIDSHAAFVAAGVGRIESSELLPVASVKCKEVTLRQALRSQDYDKLASATAAEILKQQNIGCLGTEVFESVPSGVGVVDAHILFKTKDDGRFTCRIAAMGNRLPVDPSVSTYAPVSSDGDKMFTLAAMQAHCQGLGDKMNMRDFDVVGGFLRIKRTSSVRLFLRLPIDMPHELAGKYVEILGALYGLRESNRLFALEACKVVKSAGFKQSIVSPCSFVAFDPGDVNKKCVVNTHVDDFRSLDNSSPLAERLYSALIARFGEITTHDQSVTFAGIEQLQHDNGAVSLTQDRYVARTASAIGISHLPPVDVPTHADFFKPLDLPDDLKSVDIEAYASLTGHLVQMLKTRDEIRPFVSFLCSKNATPCEGDFAKAIHVLRYVYSTPGIGRVFKASEVKIYAHSDSAFCLQEEGRSSGACFLSVGSQNAPFHSEADALVDVALCPMTAEYYAAGKSCQCVIHYRQLAEDLGWPQDGPTELFMDNKTAINLVNAPEVTRKCKHIEVKHHFIRQLVARKTMRVVYVNSADMRADVLTKYLPRAMFLRLRDKLLNCGALQEK